MKYFIFIVLGLFASAFIAAQDMPTVSSPEMPTFSSFPTISTNQKNLHSQQTEKKAENIKKDILDEQPQDKSFLTAANLAELTNSLAGNTSGQTDFLSKLFGNKFDSKNSETTNILLQQILTQLESMQKEATEKIVFDSIQENPKTFEEKPQSNAKIIRFTANGYNLLSTCREIFSSGKSEDGSFLITGDRKYLSNNQTRNETFYMLFNKTSVKTYDVAVTVLQDYTNTYSFLYQLSGKNPLTAYSIGNLVKLTVNEPDWKFDLLIDIADLQ
ncbi:MAG: hypothetical protein GX297_08940 [Treponema sp.]|jgi:hypothetical protein|nr:hypothetical protein [Treponema sp.]